MPASSQADFRTFTHMQPLTASAIKHIFEEHNIAPKKYLGQNFLVDANSIGKVIRTASLDPRQTVIEIGPGIGALTQEIAPRVKKLIVVEKDPQILSILQDRMKQFSHIKYVCADILQYDVPNTSYSIISNLPYAITGPVLRKFLENPHQPEPNDAHDAKRGSATHHRASASHEPSCCFRAAVCCDETYKPRIKALLLAAPEGRLLYSRNHATSKLHFSNRKSGTFFYCREGWIFSTKETTRQQPFCRTQHIKRRSCLASSTSQYRSHSTRRNPLYPRLDLLVAPS